jgi:hypothetical protein
MRLLSQLLTHSMKTAACATRAGAFALCFALAFGCVTCLPAVADDMAAFSSNGITVSFTLPTLQNVTYSLISNQSSSGPSVQGDATLVYGSQSFSWNGQTLSYEFDPASGTAARPAPASGLADSSIDQSYNTFLRIVNTNSHSVDISVLASLSLSATATSSGDASSGVAAILQGFNIAEQCRFQSIHGSTATEICLNFATLPVTVTSDSFISDYVIGANTTQDVSVFADSSGSAFVPSNVPEPGSFVLLNTAAVLGLAGAFRRKLLLRP